MATPAFQYLVYHPVTRVRMGQLDVREAKWTEIVNGGTTFSGKITVADNPISAAQTRNITTPYAAAIYAVNDDTGAISFGGPIVNRDWDGETNSLSITALDWKSWFYRIILGPRTTTMDAWTQTYTGVDQLTIAADMIARASDPTQGVPVMEAASYLSGINRNYIVSGIDFKSLGTHLDELGGLANGGFEWEVEPYYASDGLPRPRVQFYIPQRGGKVAGLLFRKTPDGGNILRVDDVTDDASAVASRVWAVGEGPNAESTPWGNDSDPSLAQGAQLRTDQVTKYSGALTVAQLGSYARTERLYRSEYLSAVSFTVRMDNPAQTSYGKGDRCHVVIQDRFLDVDVQNARILAREMSPDNNTIKLTVNLNDIVLPEVDAGGSV